ncbi:WYL domain-containing protein [Virgibacillus oceani]|uniref:WYL domain-containing protein n=1 Tax=Virgibacillus oceani TaxID=1479511 RepID=A0A917HMP1_9BACI|nr:hypothetical protein [Virgibacillus oceani]GGG84411.1 hypothetical protein GCM10011398_32600 [Virgibacillus oceani]
MKRLLVNSVETNQKLEIIYLSDHNQLSQRVIKVIRVKDDTVLAYCFSKKEVRTFKLDNILSAGSVRKRLGA